MPSQGRPKTIASTYERFPARLPRDVMDVLWERSLETGAPINTLLIKAVRRGLRLRQPDETSHDHEGASTPA
jgi:hypothetical protein